MVPLWYKIDKGLAPNPHHLIRYPQPTLVGILQGTQPLKSPIKIFTQNSGDDANLMIGFLNNQVKGATAVVLSLLIPLRWW